MSNAERKAQLTISEPWDMSDTLSVVIRYQAALGNLWVLVVSTNGELLALLPRYKGEKVEDVWLGKKLVVNIARIKNITAGELNKLDLSRLEFFAIGSITLLE